MLLVRVGRMKTATVTTANGTAIAFMKGMRRPPLKLARSDQLATSGSVTASNRRPTAVMTPKRVRDAISGFWRIKLLRTPLVSRNFSGLPVNMWTSQVEMMPARRLQPNWPTAKIHRTLLVIGLRAFLGVEVLLLIVSSFPD